MEKRHMRPEEHDEISSRLLDRLESIKAALEAARNDKRLMRVLHREDHELRREFAKHLAIEVTRHCAWNGEHKTAGSYERDGKVVRTVLAVDGQPTKTGKVAAIAWMASRNATWVGTAPELRREVKKALKGCESVPDGFFGLYVDRTVEIGSQEWLILEHERGFQMVPGARRYR
jgi:hypothetical protein